MGGGKYKTPSGGVGGVGGETILFSKQRRDDGRGKEQVRIFNIFLNHMGLVLSLG